FFIAISFPEPRHYGVVFKKYKKTLLGLLPIKVHGTIWLPLHQDMPRTRFTLFQRPSVTTGMNPMK
ncbi:hypothetical protein, partial [Acidaminococcus intestini]|uniref:hypothetical protein n=1 Tax=Acidaminococcus intestini TaxID=187327 RepID=UPI00307F4C37